MPKSALALILVPGMLTVLGLAALGWGGLAFPRPPTHRPDASVFVVHCRSTLQRSQSQRWRVGGSRGSLGAVGLRRPRASPELPTRSDRPARHVDHRWQHRTLAGVAVFTAGGALRVWPVFVLGRRFSGLVAIQSGHTLVTTGIDQCIRHPSYLGLLVASVGWALVFRSVIGLLLSGALLVPLIARIRYEERLLAGEFGEVYADYRRRTWRLIPGLY